MLKPLFSSPSLSLTFRHFTQSLRDMERYTVEAKVNDGSHTQINNKPPKLSSTSPSVPFPIKPTISVRDTELSIFTAERYFNDDDKNDKGIISNITETERSDLSNFTRDTSVSSTADDYRGNLQVTPSVSSEASWNSRSGLLKNHKGSAVAASAVVASRALCCPRRSRSSSRWRFGGGCPCSGKRSVDVEERITEPRNPKLNSGNVGLGGDVGSSGVENPKGNRPSLSVVSVPKLKLISGDDLEKERETFTFQTSKLLYSRENPSRIGHRIVTSGVPFVENGNNFSFPILTKSTQDVPPRDSLEVFQPKEEKNSMSSPRWKPTSLLMLPVNPTIGRVLDDDVASDSSSDLFEIESFSTQMTSGLTNRRRDSLDEILAMDPRRFIENAAGILHLRQGVEEPARPSIAPSECYPPSEVSVQWSVTTAEGFANFSTAASEYEETPATAFHAVPEKEMVTGGISGGKKKGGLLSCRCEKAVSVGPHPLRYVPEQRRSGVVVESGHSPPVAAATIGFGRGSERPPLARSHSARSSRPIQTR